MGASKVPAKVHRAVVRLPHRRTDLSAAHALWFARERRRYVAQRREIQSLMVLPHRALQKYEARYRQSMRRGGEVASLSELYGAVRASDVVHVGDYHTLPRAQAAYLSILAASCRSGRPTVAALECIEGRHQKRIDDYLNRRIALSVLRQCVGHPFGAADNLWQSFASILEFARTEGIRVVALDRRARGKRALALRDRYAARVIARASNALDRPRVVVLMGQFHLAPPHLPRALTDATRNSPLQQLTIVQNVDDLYWRLAKSRRPRLGTVMRLAERRYCLFSATPTMAQASFLRYIDSVAGNS